MKPLPLYTVVTRVATYVHFGGCDMIHDWAVHKTFGGLLLPILTTALYKVHIQGPQ